MPPLGSVIKISITIKVTDINSSSLIAVFSSSKRDPYLHYNGSMRKFPEYLMDGETNEIFITSTCLWKENSSYNWL